MKNAGMAYQQKTGRLILVKPYTTHQDLERAVLRREPDLIVNKMATSLKMGYTPFVTLGFFNEPTPKECVYVQKTSPYKSVKDLRGKSFGQKFDASLRFIRLAWLANAEPLRFFSPLKGAKNDESLAMMLSLGQVDGALLQMWVVELMKLTNPGMVQKFKRLECTQVCPQYLSVSPNLTAQDLASLKAFLLNFRKEPGMQRYLGLLNRLGMVTQPYSKQAMDSCNARTTKLQAAFQKNGWTPDTQYPWFEYRPPVTPPKR